MPEDIKVLFTPTDAAVGGLAGFQAAQAIDDCMEAWTKALRSLAGMVGSTADAVGSSAKGFTHEDQERRKAFLGPTLQASAHRASTRRTVGTEHAGLGAP
ncbi:hypothetical protein [Streptomyces sp. NPDC048462]|uniref:hypothetical protein n=1 Tax=Streptomyces sp. NPDC048462 TaxID=3365555 RepID=UPI00371D7D75